MATDAADPVEDRVRADATESARRRNVVRDMGLFSAGVVLGPALLTLTFRFTPMSVDLWVPDVVFMALIAVMFFVLRWRWLALGMFISASIWIVSIIWLTASVSPDW